MNKNEFKSFVNDMVHFYGVRSCLMNDDDMEEESYWFECPECCDPILFEDYGDSEILAAGYCPICGCALKDECEMENYFDGE